MGGSLGINTHCSDIWTQKCESEPLMGQSGNVDVLVLSCYTEETSGKVTVEKWVSMLGRLEELFTGTDNLSGFITQSK